MADEGCWEVAYRLRYPVAILTRRDDEPSLGLHFIYGEGSWLSEVRHRVMASLDTRDVGILDASERALRGFWEYVSFYSGLPIAFHPLAATRVDLRPGISVGFTIALKVGASAVVSRRVEIPTSQTLAAVSGRAVVWFTLANLAREAVSDADAVRNYYMILEDRYSHPQPNAVNRVRWTRHFCSHGSELIDENLLNFIQAETGRRDKQYDPNNPRHAELMKRIREEARRLVAVELNQLF